MIVEISLKRGVAAGGLLVGVAAVCALLIRLVLFNFIVFSLSDSRSPVSTGALQTATGYFPSSARLNAKLAEAQISDPARDLGLAAQDIERATRLSPYDYRLRVVLASAKESQGDLAGADAALREAASLAPSNIDVRWRLANLLLRAGKINDSLAEFRAAVMGNQALMPAALDLIWRVTGGDLPSLEAVAPATPEGHLSLANFLLKQGQTSQAARIFEGIDRESRRAAPASSDFIDTLVNSGELALARQLWINLVSTDASGAVPNDRIIWNGGFESDPVPGLSQFDWNLGESAYAVIGIDNGTAHQAGRSLRIDFEGRDTTVLDGEIKQRVALQPGKHYKLEYYVKTRDLVTTDGPRVALGCDRYPGWTPAGPAIAAGTGDWRKMEIDFVAPLQQGAPGSSGQSVRGPAPNTTYNGPTQSPGRAGDVQETRQSAKNAVAVTVRVIRSPKFSYDEPMRGTIWLDDFRIVQID